MLEEIYYEGHKSVEVIEKHWVEKGILLDR